MVATCSALSLSIQIRVDLGLDHPIHRRLWGLRRVNIILATSSLASALQKLFKMMRPGLSMGSNALVFSDG